MSGYVYLIRNGDLYMIGRAANLEAKIKSLSPDEIIKTIKVDNPKTFQARLFRRYKSKRVPDTEYFRLNSDQLADCFNQLGSNSFMPTTLGAEINIAFTASLLLSISFFIIFFYMGNGILNSLSECLVIASLPMWLLFILGDFGGYDITDLPLFTSWLNRIKALIIALSITSISYTIFSIHQ